MLIFRGPVVRVDSAGPSTGGILLSPDKRRLVWDIGQYVAWCIREFKKLSLGILKLNFLKLR